MIKCRHFIWEFIKTKDVGGSRKYSHPCHITVFLHKNPVHKMFFHVLLFRYFIAMLAICHPDTESPFDSSLSSSVILQDLIHLQLIL